MDNRYLVESAGGGDSAGGSDSAGGKVTIADLQARGSVTTDLRELQQCLKMLGDRCHELLNRMRMMTSEGMQRREALAPEVRTFKKLDAEGKQAEIDNMMKKLWMEVEKLTRTAVGPVDDLQRFQRHVDTAERAVEKLQAGMKTQMAVQVAAMCKSWEREAAATTCWVEVYDQDPSVKSDKTAVRLRCGYITEADDMLEGLCRLLPLEEWDQVYCCSPGEFSTNTKLFWLLSGGRGEQVRDRLQAKKNLVFHNEASKKQLVIVRR
jgi:hypothetical protein